MRKITCTEAREHDEQRAVKHHKPIRDIASFTIERSVADQLRMNASARGVSLSEMVRTLVLKGVGINE